VKHRSQLLLAAALVAATCALYGAFYLLYRDRALVAQWFLGSLAFVPVQVLLVTLVVDGMLSRRERAGRLKKLNIVIGVFFSEVGHALMAGCLALDRREEELRAALGCASTWSPRQLARGSAEYRSYQPAIEPRSPALDRLRAVLSDRRAVITELMVNPSVLEHESFTDLLWAAFHLAEELGARGRLEALTAHDSAHLAGDVRRVFPLLVAEWLGYLRHLQEDYPHLFSLEARMNPFDAGAHVDVRDAAA